MNHTRRRLLLGIGMAGAGAGLIGGTGAFTSVEADREVTVEFADDSAALLQMTPVGGGTDERDFVTVTEGEDGTISIEIENVNRNARTVIDNLVEFTNNGSQTVTLEASFTDGSDEAGPLRIHDDLSDISPLEPDNNDSNSEVGLGLTIDLRGETGNIEISETITITAESTED